MSPAISVNKGCGSYQDVSHCSKPPTPTVHPREFRVEKKRMAALKTQAHIEGIISMSPGSCTFPYAEKYH